MAEEPEFADTEKPDEIYDIIERYFYLYKRFCLGRKRIELFAKKKRSGWLSIGPDLTLTDFN